jgi:hypothetical protein
VISSEMVMAKVKKLPTFSATLVRLWSVSRDERSGAADFEKVVRPDPALTAD